MYSKNELLDKLKEFSIQLKRAPKKYDIDKDNNMPSSSTYKYQFGSLTKALSEVGLAPNRHLDLTIDSFVEYIKKYYKEFAVVPTADDFHNNPHYPSPTFITQVKMTWVEIIALAGLPTFTRGDTWVKNRNSELQIKGMLINAGFNVVDLKEKSISEGSFKINDSIIRVRTSKLIQRKQKNTVGYGWKFKLHINDSINIDYYICFGMNEDSELYSLYILPTNEMEVKQTISINANREDKSKYYKYKIAIKDLCDYHFD